MGASRLRPLTVKEVEKLTAVKLTAINHRSLTPNMRLILSCMTD